MLLIECYSNDNINDLTQKLPVESFFCVTPKHLDGSLVMQVFIDLAKVTVPPAIAAISSYLVASRNNSTIKIKFNDCNKIEAEIQGKLSDKSLIDSQLYQELVQLLCDQVKREQSHEDND